MSGPSSTQPAPTAYDPTWQAGADSTYQNLLQNATPWASSLPSTVLPAGQSATNNIVNNPYAASAQSGANATGSAATNFANQLGYYANNDSNLNNYQLGTLGNLGLTASQIGTDSANLGYSAQAAGSGVLAAGNQGYGQTQAMIPSTTQGGSYALPALLSALSMAGQTTGGMGAADQVLYNAFDPQSQLYDQQYQQTMDQQNAINAMNGVSGSGYGSGLDSQASQNFNLNWQNNQLQRQIAALGAYGTQESTVANNYANLSNAGVNQYDNLTSTAVNNLDNLVNTGMSAKNTGFQDYNAGVQTAQQGQMDQLAATNAQAAYTNDQVANQASLYSNTNQLGQSSLEAQQLGYQLPYQTYLGQQTDSLSALAGLSTLYGSALQPTSGLSSLLNSYLGLGQNATSINQNATSINNQAAESNQTAIGDMLGSLFGSNGMLGGVTSGVSSALASMLGGGGTAAGAAAGGGDFADAMLMFA